MLGTFRVSRSLSTPLSSLQSWKKAKIYFLCLICILSHDYRYLNISFWKIACLFVYAISLDDEMNSPDCITLDGTLALSRNATMIFLFSRRYFTLPNSFLLALRRKRRVPTDVDTRSHSTSTTSCEFPLKPAGYPQEMDGCRGSTCPGKIPLRLSCFNDRLY